jgi:hypothetical protein
MEASFCFFGEKLHAPQKNVKEIGLEAMATNGKT